jgi:hypothetical protein
MPHQSVREWIRSSARQLEKELARFKNGSDWKTVLQLYQVREILSTDQLLTLRDEDRRYLRTTLHRFNKLAADNQFGAVTRLPGFTPLRNGLRDLLFAGASDERSPIVSQNNAVRPDAASDESDRDR